MYTSTTSGLFTICFSSATVNLLSFFNFFFPITGSFGSSVSESEFSESLLLDLFSSFSLFSSFALFPSVPSPPSSSFSSPPWFKKWLNTSLNCSYSGLLKFGVSTSYSISTSCVSSSYFFFFFFFFFFFSFFFFFYFFFVIKNLFYY